MATRKYEQKYTDFCDNLYGALQGAYDEGYEAGRESNRHRGKNLVLPFNDPNFAVVLTCAVRNALDMPATAVTVCQFVTVLLPHLDYKTLWTMERDIKNSAAKIAQCNRDTAETWNDFHRDVVVAKSRKQK